MLAISYSPRPTVSFHAAARINEKSKQSHPFKMSPFLTFWLILCSLPQTQSYSNETATASYAQNAWKRKKALIRTKSFLHCTGCQGKLDQSEAASTKAGVNFLCCNSSCQKASLIRSQYWEWVNSDERGCARWLCNWIGIFMQAILTKCILRRKAYLLRG